jgi:uncharacterized protein YcbK (DUF882 family)
MHRSKRIGLGLALSLLTAGGLGAASLRATRSSQAIQNERADEDNLSRMEDRAMVQRWARLELLARVPDKTSTYYLHSVHDENQYLRPWAKLFLERLSRQYHARHRKPLRVTSLLRTAAYQQSLSRRNGNAAAAEGPKRSAHLTGACLDVSKKGMTRAQQAWVRSVLASLKTKGYVYAVEEFQQPVFHILVHRDYEDYVEARR